MAGEFCPPFSNQESQQPQLPQKQHASAERRPRPEHTTETRYPATHQQACVRFRAHWDAREYAAAADYAALAHTLAEEAGDVALAAKYAKARQLAHGYQALRVEMRQLNWQVGVHPVLDPDDPASSEARCNMVCTPDRPAEGIEYDFERAGKGLSERQTGNRDDVHAHREPDTRRNRQLPSGKPLAAPAYEQRHLPLVHSDKLVDEPRAATFEERRSAMCCMPYFTWSSWKRKR